MLLTKNNIFILAIIIMSIVGYQFYITLPPSQSSTQAHVKPSSGSSSGKIGSDLNELIKLQNDLKKQQSEIKRQLELIKDSIDNVNENINENYNNFGGNGNQDGDGDDESQMFNNNRRNNKNRKLPKKPYDETNEEEEGSDSIVLPSQIEYEERLKKTALDQPNTCIPLEGKLLCLPNFIVIGTMKSGTTFLDYYLQKHPQIAHHNKKEVWYFNSYYGNGIEWYTKHFEQYTSLENQKLIGEATPFYINNPNTAPRLYSTLKNAKLILLLRDPVERSLSQYYFSIQWLKKNKSPPLNYTFEQLIYEEADVIETCVRGHERYREAFNARKLAESRGEVDLDEPFDLVDPFYTLHSEKKWTFYKDCTKCDRCFQQGSILHTSGHPTFGMLAKSLYYEQIDYWLNYFPLSQIHIIRYEDIALHPELVLRDLEDYLVIDHHDYGEFKPKNVVQHDPMEDEIRSYLKKYFEHENKKLYKLLGRDFEWQK